MKNTKVLVTGGAGYIGSVLVPHLLEEGYEVTVIDNLHYKQTSLLPCFRHPKFRFVRGDVTHLSPLKEEMDKAEVIIPLAAIVGAPACDRSPRLAESINVGAVDLLIENLRPEHKILYPNTNSGYGVGERGAFCTEESPLRPISSYGKQKVASEQKLLATRQAISLRLATVFGISPRMRLDLLVNDFTFRACHDRSIILFEEHFKRNYIHVRDVAWAFQFALEHFEAMKGEPFNVGLSSANLSKKELCETIQRFLPHLYIHGASIGKDEDQRDYVVSNEKLERLGWKPKVTLEEGIQEIIAAYPMLQASGFKNV